ncbi:MAG: hypothetical protein Q8M92_02235 [Candidatus Subteraquimicrobiales bacterium]|nr:hypothetical protein [Candidatus Subteraquimicrobiales bacterium]
MEKPRFIKHLVEDAKRGGRGERNDSAVREQRGDKGEKKENLEEREMSLEE